MQYNRLISIVFYIIVSMQPLNAGAGPRAVLGVNIATGGGANGPVEGVLVLGVTPGGPADDAGLQPDDVLVGIDGMSLTADSRREANRRLLEVMEDAEPGDELALDFLRAGRIRKAMITAAGYDPDLMPPGFADELRRLGDQFGRTVVDPLIHRWRHAGVFAGLELVALTPDLGRYFGTSTGLLVIRAPENQSIGLRDGDVIKAIGGRRPATPAHAMRILRSYASGEKLLLEIMRDRDEQTIEFELAEPESPVPSEP